MEFDTIDALRAACMELPAADERASAAAAARQAVLTKPAGSLGRLEDIALWLAAWQGRPDPVIEQPAVLVFAGSHGITRRGVSAFPAEVTAQMVANFAAGGAAVNQLARTAGAQLEVIDLSVDRPTGDFSEEAAMDEADFLAAVNAGYRAVPEGTDLLALGEMGIGNTTVAAAVAAGLFGGTGADWVGRGTGVDDDGLARKAAAVDAGLTRHADAFGDPLAVLARLGGRELAAIFGATLAARRRRVPVVLDGFVCTAAAAPLARLHGTGLAHTLAGHCSAEAGHRRLLEILRLDPLLDLSMRLGEASGACVAMLVVKAALACHSGMATFADAGVSSGG